MSKPNQRRHFRLEYPPDDRPKLALDRQAYDVLDLSEGGIKFALTPQFKLQEKSALRGTVTFRDGKAVDVKGVVLRLAPDRTFCVALLTEGIPLAKMMEEQRMLIRKYRTNDL